MNKSFMLISCQIGEEQAIYSELKKFPGVKNCTVTFGSYDIVAELETETELQMKELLASKIRKLDKIRSTITLNTV
jgi:DNA-binding Lrp family transcriptional regulator